MFEKYLQDIGLNDKEAAVYVALLGFENASALELANKTSIKRPTVYTALESLSKKGLVSETTVGKKTNYYAEVPDRLETFLERKIINLEESKKVLMDLIPQLKSITRESGERPVVKFFDGKEGILTSTEETLQYIDNSGEPMYFFYSKDLLEDIFSKEELEKLRQRRISKKVKSKSIYNYSKGDFSSDQMGDRLRIDENKYPITCDITVYKDTVRISILGKRISSIFIRNKDVAETLKSLFRLVHDSKKG